MPLLRWPVGQEGKSCFHCRGPGTLILPSSHLRQPPHSSCDRGEPSPWYAGPRWNQLWHKGGSRGCKGHARADHDGGVPGLRQSNQHHVAGGGCMASTMLGAVGMVATMFSSADAAGAKFKAPLGGEAKAAGRTGAPSPGYLALNGGKWRKPLDSHPLCRGPKCREETTERKLTHRAHSPHLVTLGFCCPQLPQLAPPTSSTCCLLPLWGLAADASASRPPCWSRATIPAPSPVPGASGGGTGPLWHPCSSESWGLQQLPDSHSTFLLRVLLLFSSLFCSHPSCSFPCTMYTLSLSLCLMLTGAELQAS